jgi:hypothetical protein
VTWFQAVSFFSVIESLKEYLKTGFFKRPNPVKPEKCLKLRMLIIFKKRSSEFRIPQANLAGFSKNESWVLNTDWVATEGQHR